MLLMLQPGPNWNQDRGLPMTDNEHFATCDRALWELPELYQVARLQDILPVDFLATQQPRSQIFIDACMYLELTVFVHVCYCLHFLLYNMNILHSLSISSCI